jgi:adenylate cyclase
LPTGSSSGSQPRVTRDVNRASIPRRSPVTGRPLRLGLLGRFSVEAEGRLVEVPGKKAQGLLAYLALPSGRRHSREHLAGLLWGDMPEERARHNLRQCVSAVRRILGEGVIAADGDALYLDPRVVEVDVAALENGDGKPTGPTGLGELLEGLSLGEDPFDEWLADQRARLTRLTCDRLGAAATARAEEGAVDEAMELARRLLALDPASEEGHRLLIEFYGRCGRRPAAIRQYQTCVAALQRHLGVAPSAETVRLYESLRRPRSDEPAAARAAAAVGAPDPHSLPDRPSIVVLEFTSLEDSAGQEYFGMGIAEDITTALSRFGSLLVISPVTTYALRGQDQEPRRVGRELGVHYVVRGTVRRRGERVRVTVHLVDSLTGAEVWAHQHDGDLGEIFRVQDEIVQMLVATLVGRVEADSLDHARRKAPESLAAYDCFLRGKDYHHRFTLEDNTRAIDMFERAVVLDPAYALGYAWLACALFQRTFFVQDQALVTRCFEQVQKAYMLDDGESEVHRILGAFHLVWQEFDKAEFHLERALTLNPNDDRIVCQMGELATFLGRPEEGEQWVRRAMRLNPYYMPRYWLRLARALYHQGRFEEALDALQREPIPVPHQLTYLAAILARLGRDEAARGVIRELQTQERALTVGDLTRALPYRRPEDRDDVTAALRLAGLPA